MISLRETKGVISANHSMKLAQIILDRSSRQNDSPWGLQSVEHSGSLIIGGLQSVTWGHRQMVFNPASAVTDPHRIQSIRLVA